jgi:WD40 repeat protein
MDETVRVWDGTAGQEAHAIPETSSALYSVAVSPDGNRVACLRPGGFFLPLVIVDAGTGREVRTLRSFSITNAPALAFRADNRLLASAGGSEVQVWDVASGKELARFKGQANYLGPSVAFSPDGKRLAFVGENSTIEVWDWTKREHVTTFRGHPINVTCLTYSPDGRRIASGGWGRRRPDLKLNLPGEARVWDAATGKEILGLPVHSEIILGVAFSKDGKRLATTSMDQTASIWDAESGKELRVLPGHTSEVRSAAFSGDSRRVATASLDGTVKLWDASTGEEILTLTVPAKTKQPPFAHKVSFVVNDQKLAVGASSGVFLWDGTPRKEKTGP